MKKNFFKKLSLLLVLAMVISVFAPVGASAAAAPALNAKTKYLVLGEKARETFNFKVKNAKKGWQYAWKSADNAVVTVSDKGVATAQGIGTATVSVNITDKDGKKVDALKGKVIVYDNVDKVYVDGTVPAGEEVKVGETVDFSRTFETKSGSTEATSDITRWVVREGAVLTDGATIKTTGRATAEFVATEPGVYRVYAATFQSPAKFRAWDATVGGTKLKHRLVTSYSKAYELVVVGDAAELEIKKVLPVSSNKLVVNFNQELEMVSADNFEIAGVTVVAANLSENKMDVELSVLGLEYDKEYTVLAKDIIVAGSNEEDKQSAEGKFTSLKASDVFKLKITFDGLNNDNPVLKADGASSAVVRVELVDQLGNLLTDQGDVEIYFDTTFGRLGEKKVTAQNGVATNLITSETLQSAKIASVRAQVIEASNKDLINIEASVDLAMLPNPDGGVVDIAGARVTGAQAETADRITLFFNRAVSPADYVFPSNHADAGKIDPSKAFVAVAKGTAKTDVVFVGLKAVPGNSKALELILAADSAANVLTDNDYVEVQFTDKTGTVEVPSTINFIAIDSRRPSMLNVVPEGLTKVKVTFSEPVVSIGGSLSAIEAANWRIDGYLLSSSQWGTTKITVGNFDPKTGADNRNIVTIELGTGVYFGAGKHSVQGSGIADWAGLSDPNGNIMNTQTLDFTIQEDNRTPSASVEVQSPEQYIVNFNMVVARNSAVAGNLEDIFELQVLGKDGNWKKAAGNITDDLKSEVKFAVAPSYTVEAIANTNSYKVELTKDWTVLYNTSATNKNYYNDSYRIVVSEKAFISVVNGKESAKFELGLGGPMSAPDHFSPQITGYDYSKNTVTMSEPVKLSADTNKTLAQTQTALPVVTAQFIKTDLSKTIDATVGTTTTDAYDKQFEVKPATALEAGDWTIVIRAISDDIGNTAASATFNFTVEGTAPVAQEFEILSITTDTSGSVGKIEIVFSQAYAFTGGFSSAIVTGNYQVNGYQLPTGTSIERTDVKDGSGNVTKHAIEIVMPSGTLTAGSNNVIQISTAIRNAAGDKYIKNIGSGQFKMDWTRPTP